MKKTLQQILGLLPTLVEDVNTAEEKLDGQQYSRRVYVRTLFAMIEGVTYAMKLALFGIGREYCKLKVPDLVVLKESTFDLNPKGKIQEKPKHFRTADNLRFTVRTVEHVLKSSIDLGVGTQDWTNFKKAIKIRNHITHPKKPEDFVISDAELKCICSVNSWFNEIVKEMMKALTDYFNGGAGRTELCRERRIRSF